MTLDLLARYGGGILAVVACFGFIIFIHELGHFLVARRAGIRCPYFAIGFGPKLFSFRWKATEFSVRIFPFGGFVQMEGEEPGQTGEDSWHGQMAHFLGEATFPARPAQLLAYLDELKSRNSDMVLSPENQARFDEVREHVQFSANRSYADLSDLEGNFNHKSIPARIAVVLGGVTMNFISALLLFWFVGLVWGVANAAPVAEPRVNEVMKGGPAEAAGIKAKDTIVEVQRRPIVTGQEMIEEIGRYPGEPITVKIKRGNATIDYEVVPNVSVGRVMFKPDGSGVKVMAPGESAFKDGDRVTQVNGQSFQGLAGFVALVRQLAPAEQESKLTFSVEGRGPVELKGKLKPEGKIGVIPGSPMHIVIVSTAIGLVTEVAPGSPAASAGLKPQDHILAVDGRHIFGQDDLAELLGRLGGREVDLEVLRHGEDETVTLTVPPDGLAGLGIKLQPVDAAFVLKYGVTKLGRLIIQPYEIIYGLMARKIEAKTIKEQTGGPLMIMGMIFDVSASGLPTLLFFLALLNAAVGAFNLLPFPALDGSRLFFLVVAAIRKKEIDPEKEARIHYYGLLLLLGLVALISVNDVGRIWSGTQLVK